MRKMGGWIVLMSVRMFLNDNAFIINILVVILFSQHRITFRVSNKLRTPTIFSFFRKRNTFHLNWNSCVRDFGVALSLSKRSSTCRKVFIARDKWGHIYFSRK